MPRPRPLYLHCEKTRHGKIVWYVRIEKGARIRIPYNYGTPEFSQAYQDAIAGQPLAKPPTTAQEGSFSWALLRYRSSQNWLSLSPATRRQRENIFKPIEQALGTSKLSAWKRGDIIAGRDKRSDRPASARNFVEALRGFFHWCVDAGLIKIDPTEGVKIIMPRTEGFQVWTEGDIAAFRNHWPIGTRERLAFELIYATGLRRGDAVRIGPAHLKDGIIRIATEKTGERVAVPISDDFLKAIANCPCGETTFIAGLRGQPMTKESFGNWFREIANAAGVAKSAHGIRKAAATADALAGYTDAELDAKFGWTGRKMASLYTRSANRERLAIAAANRTKAQNPIPAPPKKVRD